MSETQPSRRNQIAVGSTAAPKERNRSESRSSVMIDLIAAETQPVAHQLQRTILRIQAAGPREILREREASMKREKKPETTFSPVVPLPGTLHKDMNDRESQVDREKTTA